MSVLVTGGAGNVGSPIVSALLGRSEDVVVLDDLSTGVRARVAERAIFVHGDIADCGLVRSLIDGHHVDAVMHFAGSNFVPESVQQPLRYYANNAVASRALIEACVERGVKHFIFSSTATVFADDAPQPLAEDERKAPTSPYARSKLMTEWMLEDVSRVSDLRHVVLRYFNVCGTDPGGRTGQVSRIPTHLIRRAAMVALGRIPVLDIFGTDFPTPDGTGVRDYIHASDLAAAHLLALDALRAGSPSTSYNCGYGHGLSVRQVVAAVEAIIGRNLPTREMPRRAGDPATLIADPSRIKKALGWKPQHDDIRDIVRSVLEWERRLNN